MKTKKLYLTNWIYFFYGVLVLAMLSCTKESVLPEDPSSLDLNDAIPHYQKEVDKNDY